MSDFGTEKASGAVLAARNELAEQVRQALGRAGLPAYVEGPDSGGQPGATLEVNPDADTEEAPVALHWSCDPGMVQAALDALQAGDTTSEVVRYPGMIGLHMQDALIKILVSSGFLAEPNTDSMNPEYVLVFGKSP
jgi:hypothetical protein